MNIWYFLVLFCFLNETMIYLLQIPYMNTNDYDYITPPTFPPTHPRTYQAVSFPNSSCSLKKILLSLVHWTQLVLCVLFQEDSISQSPHHSAALTFFMSSLPWWSPCRGWDEVDTVYLSRIGHHSHSPYQNLSWTTDYAMTLVMFHEKSTVFLPIGYSPKI